MIRNSRRPIGQSSRKFLLFGLKVLNKMKPEILVIFSRGPSFAQSIATNHWTSPNRFSRNDWPLAEKN